MVEFLPDPTEEGQNQINNQHTTTIIRHYADFNSSQKLTNVPLNGKNYIPWAKAAKVTLKAKRLLGYINGSKKRPMEGTEAQEEWDMVDSQAMTLISNSIEPQLSTSFWTCKTAAELWQAIEKQFSDQRSHSQIYQLKNEIGKITQESRDIPDLIGHVIAKYEELKLYRPPTTDLSVLQEREEMDKIYTFLAALDSSYEAVRAQILLSKEKLIFDDVTARIRQEATRRVAMKTADLNPKLEAHAFSAQHLNANKGKGKGEIDRCSHCKRDGHTQEKCWIRKRGRKGG
ncbi:uncharacterized protein LOC144573717 [Carex rostrata]